ncbi:hypothetical protein [Methylobacterium nigriterrae]|uniref:hypothetical protein n=1 Tax=Methylobacterium nigriterrae TaxID=3127512 RepID=UPI003013EA61
MTRFYRVETRKRGLVGKLCKGALVGFNGLMVWALWSALTTACTLGGHGMSAVAGTLGHVHTTVGEAALAILWLIGTAILGLLTFVTRSRMVVLIEERAP